MYKPNYFQRRTKFQGPRTNHRIKSIDVQVINSSGENKYPLLNLSKSFTLFGDIKGRIFIKFARSCQENKFL